MQLTDFAAVGQCGCLVALSGDSKKAGPTRERRNTTDDLMLTNFGEGPADCHLF